MSRSFVSKIVALAVVGTLAACAEDLTAVTATWTSMNDGWTKQIADAKKAGEELGGKIAGLSAVADADAAGKDLKTKLDTAATDHKNLVAALEQLATETKTAIETASVEKKIAPVQAAIDAGKAKFDAEAAKLAPAATAANAAYDALKTHLEEEAKKAAAAAADPAAKDPEAAKTAGATITIPMTFTDKDAVDEAASAAGIERLTKFLGTCDAIKAEISANGANDKSAKARAAAVVKFVEGKGTKGKLTAPTGVVGADSAITLKVATVCP
jgi:allophanate hydrolase subunit 1